MKFKGKIVLCALVVMMPCVLHAAQKERAQSAKLDTSVVEKVAKLQKAGGEKFDPNTYFTVLTHIGMKPGYVLDYVYWADGLGSHPCLYARRAKEPRKKIGSLEGLSGEEMKKRREKLEEICGKGPLSFMTVDGSAQGFFELSVFLKLAGQFRLVWHAAYNDTRIITSAEDVNRVAAEVNSFGARKEPDPNRKLWVKAKKWFTPPEVVLTPETAEVSLTTFTKWGGFTRIKETFERNAPYARISREVLDIIPFDCGIRF